MTIRTINRHTLVLLAVLSGIIGMGVVFGAVSTGSVHDLTLGVPALLIGLWWAGRELGLSMLASRARSAARPSALGENASPKLDTEMPFERVQG